MQRILKRLYKPFHVKHRLKAYMEFTVDIIILTEPEQQTDGKALNNRFLSACEGQGVAHGEVYEI